MTFRHLLDHPFPPLSPALSARAPYLLRVGSSFACGPGGAAPPFSRRRLFFVFSSTTHPHGHAADKWSDRAESALPFFRLFSCANHSNHQPVGPNQLPQVQCELFSTHAYLSLQLARKRGQAMRFYASFPTRAFKFASLSLDIAKPSVLP